MSSYVKPAIVQKSILCETLGKLTQFSTLCFFHCASFLGKNCSDTKKKLRPKSCYQNFSNLSVKYKKTLSFVDMSFEGVIEVIEIEIHTQLKSFVNDMSENAINGISETWFTPDDDLTLWHVASSTHDLFKCDRSRNVKKKGCWCNAFCPFKTSIKRT